MDESRGLGENPNVELAEVASWDILSTTRVSTWEQQQGCWTCIRVALAANIGCVSSCTPAPLHASLHLQSVYRICANSVKCMLHRLYLYFDLKQPLTHSEPTCVFIKFSRGRGGLDFHCLIASPSLTDILDLSVFFSCLVAQNLIYYFGCLLVFFLTQCVVHCLHFVLQLLCCCPSLRPAIGIQLHLAPHQCILVAFSSFVGLLPFCICLFVCFLLAFVCLFACLLFAFVFLRLFVCSECLHLFVAYQLVSFLNLCVLAHSFVL